MNNNPLLHIFGEVLFDHFPDGSRVLGGAPFNVAWHLQAFRTIAPIHQPDRRRSAWTRNRCVNGCLGHEP